MSFAKGQRSSKMMVCYCHLTLLPVLVECRYGTSGPTADMLYHIKIATCRLISSRIIKKYFIPGYLKTPYCCTFYMQIWKAPINIVDIRQIKFDIQPGRSIVTVILYHKIFRYRHSVFKKNLFDELTSVKNLFLETACFEFPFKVQLNHAKKSNPFLTISTTLIVRLN
jgi:hypothetical protein